MTQEEFKKAIQFIEENRERGDVSRISETIGVNVRYYYGIKSTENVNDISTNQKEYVKEFYTLLYERKQQREKRKKSFIQN